MRSEHKDKQAQKPSTACEDCERTCFAFIFTCVVVKNPKTPKLSPMADDAITRSGIGGLVSLCICGNSQFRLILGDRITYLQSILGKILTMLSLQHLIKLMCGSQKIRQALESTLIISQKLVWANKHIARVAHVSLQSSNP